MTGTTKQELNTEIYNKAVPLFLKEGLRPDEQKLVEEHFPIQGRVLICGCGAGRTIIPLAKKGYIVTGLDISRPMTTAAIEQCSKAGVKADIITMDAYKAAELFKPESFDVVWFPFHAADYIEPNERRSLMFKEIHKLLKPDGVLIYNTHNRLFPRTFLQYLKQHDRDYALLVSQEGGLWTHTSTAWHAADPVKNYFKTVIVKPRYSLMRKNAKMHAKERLARLTAPLLDKSIYVIAKK